MQAQWYRVGFYSTNNYTYRLIMAQVTVSCRLAKYHKEACSEYLQGRSLEIEEVSCQELDGNDDILQWIFRTTIGVVDILR